MENIQTPEPSKEFRIYRDNQLDKSWLVGYKLKQIGRLGLTRVAETGLEVLAGIEHMMSDKSYTEARRSFGLATEHEPVMGRDNLGRFLGYIAGK